jgi:hypothetical protein
VNCSADYRCAGPDETGRCAPVCSPCYWVELGGQLRVYQAMVVALTRKRAQLERRAGAQVCRKAQKQRRDLLRRSDLLAGFGTLTIRNYRTARTGYEAHNGFHDAHPTGERAV